MSCFASIRDKILMMAIDVGFDGILPRESHTAVSTWERLLVTIYAHGPKSALNASLKSHRKNDERE